MTPISHHPVSREAMAAALVAMLGLINGPLLAAAAPPVAVLTPEEIARLLEEGAGVLKQGMPEVALTKYFEPVNQSFMRQTAKAGADDEIYASHGATEAAAYAAKVAKRNESANTQLRMVTVDGAWTDALVLKARALVELKRTGDAISAVDQATIISPAYPSPWNELGSIYQNEKDWEKSQGAYRSAENVAGAVDDKALQTQMLTTALRGQAFALTELGRLDESEALYKRCLKINPGDSAAAEGLSHISERRAAEAGTSTAPAPVSAPAAPPAPTAH